MSGLKLLLLLFVSMDTGGEVTDWLFPDCGCAAAALVEQDVGLICLKLALRDRGRAAHREKGGKL